MNQKKVAPIVGLQRDKLIVALMLDDAVAAVNQAMKVRGITLHIDYTNKDHCARLWVSRPGVEKQGWMITNPRNKQTFFIHPAHPDLRAFTMDIMERMSNMDATIVLAAQTRFNKKPVAKVQIQFTGSQRIVLTLVDVEKGKAKIDTGFTTPDGRIP